MRFVVYRDPSNLWRWSFVVNDKTIAQSVESHKDPQRCLDEISDVRSALTAPIRFLHFSVHGLDDATVPPDNTTALSMATPPPPDHAPSSAVDSKLSDLPESSANPQHHPTLSTRPRVQSAGESA